MDHIDKTPSAPRISLLALDAERRRRQAVIDGDEGPEAAEVARRERDLFQARMDAEMEWWNEYSKRRLSPTDEFGTL